MSYKVYSIYSESIDTIYIGQTNKLDKRIKDHNSGYSTYTSKAKDWKLFHSENFSSRCEAIIREKQLKSSRGRAFLREKLEETLKNDWSSVRRETDQSTD